MKKPLKIEITSFEFKQFVSKNELIDNKQLFFSPTGRPVMISSKWKTNDKLYKLICSLLFYTQFLLNDYQIGLRFFCIENEIKNYPICQCGNKILKTLKNKHFNKFCSQKCANKYTNYNKENVYGKELSKKIWNSRRKNGNGNLSLEHKHKLSEIHKKNETIAKFKNTCLEKYGLENPGILGAYYSKAGLNYIKKFIKDNNIDENLCYYKGGGINGNEYFQMVFDPTKQKYVYFSYDLIVLNENKEINLVLEYNGSWHYTKKEMEADPNSPSHPYKTKILTKKEVYQKDLLKLNHIKQKCNHILIYWEKTKQLKNYEECY